MGKRWRIHPHQPERISQLQRGSRVSAVVAQLLICRGITDPQHVDGFLNSRLSGMREPDELPGLADAADRLLAAVRSNRRITVYGDYDADGMSSAAILMRALQLLGGQVHYYVPHRIEEGYGLNHEALRKLAARGTNVVVTVDCGIASVDEAQTARELGLELIITDHHEVGPELPDAAAVVHPGLPGSEYPFRGLCGAGVAFKLAWGLCQRASEAKRVAPTMKEFLLSALGLAAIGTVADVVPLLDENRIIVRHGLVSMKERPVLGMAALMRRTGLDAKPSLSGEDLAFTISPRLNAAGRLGQAQLAVELLTTDQADRAEAIAEYLDQLNRTRDHLERSIYLSAQKQIKEQFDVSDDPAFVLSGRGWHPGVIGIVAGRLAEKYARPVVMIAFDELGQSLGTGSARSGGVLNLHAALHACGDHLAGFGGHAAAAGLRIDEAHVEAFRSHFCEHVDAELTSADRVAQVHVDAETTLSQLTLKTLQEIELLAPFGQANPRPILCASKVHLAEPPRLMGEGQRHLSLRVHQQGTPLRAVAFGQAEWAETLQQHAGPIDIAFRPVINDFRGNRRVELQLVDWKTSEDLG